MTWFDRLSDPTSRAFRVASCILVIVALITMLAALAACTRQQAFELEQARAATLTTATSWQLSESLFVFPSMVPVTDTAAGSSTADTSISLIVRHAWLKRKNSTESVSATRSEGSKTSSRAATAPEFSSAYTQLFVATLLIVFFLVIVMVVKH